MACFLKLCQVLLFSLKGQETYCIPRQAHVCLRKFFILVLCLLRSFFSLVSAGLLDVTLKPSVFSVADVQWLGVSSCVPLYLFKNTLVSLFCKRENWCWQRLINFPLVNTGNILRKLVAQWCLTLSDPVNCSLPGSSVHGILQDRMLEWDAVSFSRVSFQPRDRTLVSCITGRFLHMWPLELSLISKVCSVLLRAESQIIVILVWDPVIFFSLLYPPYSRLNRYFLNSKVGALLQSYSHG